MEQALFNSCLNLWDHSPCVDVEVLGWALSNALLNRTDSEAIHWKLVLGEQRTHDRMS